MGGMLSSIGSGIGDAFQNKLKNRFGLNGQQPGSYRNNGGLLDGAIQGIQRYRQAQQTANGSPANMMDMSPVASSPSSMDSPAGSGATPTLMPDQSQSDDAPMKPQVGSPEDMEQSLNAPDSSPMGNIGGLAMDAFARGGVATSPTLARVAEKSPEMVGAKLVTRPTLALLGSNGPERILPLNNNPENKVNGPSIMPRYRGGR